MKMSPSTCRIGLHVFVIQFYMLAVATTQTPESLYCGPSATHASCSGQRNLRWNWACEDMMTIYNISPGDLFDKLRDEFNCNGEFILGKTGFNLSLIEKHDAGTDSVTYCQADFDPHRTWDECSDLDRSCRWSVEVCDADRPGKNCVTINSMHVNGFAQSYAGSHYYYKIYSVFVDGQLPCTRCLLQMRVDRRYGQSDIYSCFPVAIRRNESASTDKPGSNQEMVTTTIASTTAVSDEDMAKTTTAGTTGVSDEDLVKTTMAGTTVVSDEDMVKTTTAGTTGVSDEDMVKTTMAGTTAVSDEEMVKTTIAGTPGVSDGEMVKTTMAGTTAVSDEEMVKTTIASTTAVSDEEMVKTTSTTAVSDEEMVKTTSTTEGTKPVLLTTQPGDIDDGDQLDEGEKGTNSGHCNTQVGHITIFFSTMFTLIIVLF